MSINPVRISIHPSQFWECKRRLLDFSQMEVQTFQFASGVSALQISNARGFIIVLPFQGQQVWDAVFDGRRLSMQTPVKEPKKTQDFLSNVGAFFFHCGMSAMGSPGPEDQHPIHGEIVNAPFQNVYLDAGEDDCGRFVGLGGNYDHAVAFGPHYLAQPYLRLYEQEAFVHVSMRVNNLKNTPMDYMYLAHINFLPVDYGRFVYTAQYDRDHIHVRSSFPSHMKPSDKLLNMIEKIELKPETHHVLDPAFTFDPEIVLMIDYFADDEGWAHAMHIHPDGSADYVSHKPSQLDHGVRWICRTPDLQALGMEAGTAGTEGYSAEKKKGNVKVLKPGDVFECEFKMGLLKPEEAKSLEMKIETLRSQK